MSEQKSTSWWVHIDVTAIVIIGALALGGYMVKSYFSSVHQREVVAAEKAKKEREEREAEEAIKREELYKRQKKDFEETEVRRREAHEKAVAAAQQREAAAIAEARAQEEKRKNEYLEAERKRTETYELERKRIAEAQEAERQQALFLDARARALEVENQKAIITTADKDIADSHKKIEALGPKIIAYKNRMQFAMKQSEKLREAIGATTTGVSQDISDENIKNAAKNESASKEFRDMAEGYTTSTAEKSRAENTIVESKLRREQAVKTLAALGVEAKPAAAAPPPRPVAAPSANKIYTLKGGKKLVVTKAVEAGDTVSVKTDLGSFESINKADIEKIEDAP